MACILIKHFVQLNIIRRLIDTPDSPVTMSKIVIANAM